MKHVIETKITESELLECLHCGDKLDLDFHPDFGMPLWLSLAIKDGFVMAHKDCEDDPQPKPVLEHLRYVRDQ